MEAKNIMQNKQLFIGIWDQRDEYGSIRDTGGIIREKSGKLLFNVKILNELSNNQYHDMEIHVYPQELEKIGFDKILTTNEMAEELPKWVFTFNLEIKKEPRDNVFATNVKRLPRNNDFQDMDKFELVPVFHKTEDILDFKAFNHALLNGSAVEFNDAQLLNDDESFAIFQSDGEVDNSDTDRIYENLIIHDIQNQYITYDVPSENTAITERDWNKRDWIDAIYEVEDLNLAFIPSRYLMAKKLEKIAPKTEELVNTVSDSENVVKSKPEGDRALEYRLIDRFIKITKSPDYDLTFNLLDLLNFHNSIKSNTFTILAGLSGTGKSKIASAYAEAIGILSNNDSNSDQFNLVSVRPFWQDDADLLGYVDTLSNNYHPGDSGLVDTLIAANKNPDKIYMVLLDEMNLAKVEHYFSQFLSVLEMKQGRERNIKLYDKSLERRLYNSDKYPSQINIGSNVKFVGTMNTDESTFQLSDKLLDRASIISLEIIPFMDKQPALQVDSSSFSEITLDQYNNMKADHSELSKEELTFFWKFDQLIEKHLPNVGLGWRVLNSIKVFLANVPNYKEFDRKVALDYQVAQRILPKVRGTESMLKDLLTLNTSSDDKKGQIVQLLDTYSEMSNFELSKRILSKKELELKVNGFVR